MKDLLMLEWKKFSGNTVFRALGLLYILVSPFIILGGKNTFKDMPPPMPSSKTFFEFPTVWDYQGYIGNWMIPFCLGFLVIHMITSEVSNRTMRQNIITGMTRKNFFLSKLYSMFFMAILATILYVISTIVIGVLHTDGFDLELIMDNNMAVIRFFLLCVGYMSFMRFVGIHYKKGMLSLLTYFMYVLILEPILMLIHVYYFKNSSRNYWPINSIEDLMPFPLFKVPDYFVNKEWNFNILLPYSHAMGMAVLYSCIFISLAYYSFMKRDI
ncbi:MAG: ABC transporter permease subunit [Saprospiraceae bacterium]|nr:ABC transporter permease subunit [Saprospiraceae bacterium]